MGLNRIDKIMRRIACTPQIVEGWVINHHKQTNANSNVVSLDAVRAARKSNVAVAKAA